jgi:Transposase DDE domain
MMKKPVPKPKSASRAASRRSTAPKHPSREAGKSRVRFGKLPKPADRTQVPYALSRDELKSLTPGEMVKIVMATAAFQEQVGPLLDRLDAQRGRRGKRRGVEPLYSSWELEQVLLFQVMCGLRSAKEARDRLAGDRGVECRRLLGLDRERETNRRRKRKRLPGVPSESTLSRHRQRIGEEDRADAYDRCFKQIRIDHMIEFPEFVEEMRVLALDGTTVETHFKTPRYHKTTKKLLNADQVTCPEGGYGAKTAGGGKAGEGFNEVILTSMSGMPVGAETIAIHHGESKCGTRVLEEFGQEVAPHLDRTKMNVLVADGGFQSPELRRAARDASLLEQVHFASHGDKQESKKNVRERNADVRLIDGYPNWFANGHREIFCRCGGGKISKDLGTRKGRPFSRVTGECDKCGHISITSGQWRSVQNMGGVVGQNGWMRVLPGEQGKPDLAFGNPLTFNDPVAEVYGKQRFALNEGLNSNLSDRFRFNRHKRWFRRRVQVETEASVIFTIMHALAMEQRRRARAATQQPPAPIANRGGGAQVVATGPPGLAQAA